MGRKKRGGRQKQQQQQQGEAEKDADPKAAHEPINGDDDVAAAGEAATDASGSGSDSGGAEGTHGASPAGDSGGRPQLSEVDRVVERSTERVTEGLESAQRAEDLRTALADHAIFTRALVVNVHGRVLASRAIASVDDSEALALAKLFGDCERTVKHGVRLDGALFDVHRCYENIVYGRRGKDEDLEGVAVLRVNPDSDADRRFLAVTWGFPVVSARAVPAAQRFGRDFVERL